MAAVENTTDDGTLNAFPSEDKDDVEPEDCECDGLGDFSCWPCMRTRTKGNVELTTKTDVVFYLLAGQ
jgi:hypothetical protein